MLLENQRKKFLGISQADSITLDPHKSLFLSSGTGCLLVNDFRTLFRLHYIDQDLRP